VPIKTAEQQAVLMLHRTRDLLVRQRTMLVNALREMLRRSRYPGNRQSNG
jgi:transposase